MCGISKLLQYISTRDWTQDLVSPRCVLIEASDKNVRHLEIAWIGDRDIRIKKSLQMIGLVVGNVLSIFIETAQSLLIINYCPWWILLLKRVHKPVVRRSGRRDQVKSYAGLREGRNGARIKLRIFSFTWFWQLK